MAQGYDSDGSSYGVNGGANPNGIPDLALLIRNVILGAEQVMSSITHFYALSALDFVQGPPTAPWKPEFDSSYYALAPLAPGTVASAIAEINASVAYPGPGSSLWGVVILDYVLALHVRRLAHQAAAILSGGLPHARNWVPGGVTKTPTASECATIRTLLTAAEWFLINRQRPLTEIVSALAAPYDNAANGGLGLGAGYGNLLAYGAFNELGGTSAAPSKLLARGTALGGGPPVPGLNPALITEEVERSWYENSTDGLNPASGVTDPVSSKAAKAAGYSWIKAPRYSGNPMEVGPLARMWVNGDYNLASPPEPGPGGPGTKNATTVHATTPPWLVAAAGLAAPLPGLGASMSTFTLNPVYNCGISTMDRHRARALEAIKVIQRILGTDGNPDGGWLNLIDPAGSPVGGPLVGSKSLPAEGATGYGLNEAPRGALGHWLTMGSAGRVRNYQCVVPTTWNGSPADGAMPGAQRGPIEEALCTPALPLSGALSPQNLPGDEYVPVEALRVIHSFDPCIACAVHVVDAKGKKLTKIR